MVDFKKNRCDEFSDSLELLNSISYFDGELTTLFKDKLKNELVVLNWVDCDDDYNYYLSFDTTQQNLSQFRTNKKDRITLLDLIKLGSSFFILRVNKNSDFDGVVSIDFTDIPENYLPTDNSYYDKDLDPLFEKTLLEFMQLEENGKICKCACHEKGQIMMHMVDCCNYTYIKYINEDGSIDLEKLAFLKMSHHQSLNVH